jgi:single-stranded DNA-binding protein
MNSVCLVGTLSRHPVVRLEGQSQTTTFTLQIPEPGRDGSTFTLYVNCIAWGKSAEVAALLNGGDLVSVEGKLCWRKHRDTSGQDKSALAVMVRQVTVLEPAAVEASVVYLSSADNSPA